MLPTRGLLKHPLIIAAATPVVDIAFLFDQAMSTTDYAYAFGSTFKLSITAV
ncbi:hypothetical protein [Nostoc sp.]|uniref:hypothetical protein n=1 Tax=Nostoc sp. TaxID=1180 RepID=UPI002FF65EA2